MAIMATSEDRRVTEAKVVTATSEDHRVTEVLVATAASEAHRVTEALREGRVELHQAEVRRTGLMAVAPPIIE